MQIQSILRRRLSRGLRLLGKLSFFNVSKKALSMLYHAHICSILRFSISAWFGNLILKNRNNLSKVVNAASKIIGVKEDPLVLLFEKGTLKTANKILKLKKHPLNLEFILLPSQKDTSYQLLKQTGTATLFPWQLNYSTKVKIHNVHFSLKYLQTLV